MERGVINHLVAVGLFFFVAFVVLLFMAQFMDASAKTEIIDAAMSHPAALVIIILFVVVIVFIGGAAMFTQGEKGGG